MSTMRNLTEACESFTAEGFAGLLPPSSLLPVGFFAVACLVSKVLLHRRAVTEKIIDKGENKSIPSSIATALRRKRDFLKRAKDDYGYASQPCGHIDDWRPRELPNLIKPITIENHNQDDESEAYLDYAGSALPTLSQLEKVFKSSQEVLANPHSTGPAASRTRLLIQTAKKMVMDHFNGHPGRLYGLTNDGTADSHPGYEIMFTSGTTESLRIVAERFPWTQCDKCSRHSRFVYPQNSHTSVVGIRGPAQANGASFLCQSISSIAKADSDTYHEWSQSNADATSSALQKCSCLGDMHHLLAMPLECNFGGTRINVKSIVSAASAASRAKSNEQWCTLVDLAKAASTGPVNLRELDPDFACISFYKMFGEPTGLGALFVKKTSVDILMGPSNSMSSMAERTAAASRSSRHYFGGGSVDSILAGIDFAVPRSEPSSLAALVNGTVHFRGIANLVHGFQEIERVGGMAMIRKHSTCLAAELAKRLSTLRHGNGRPAVIIYGTWSKAAGHSSIDRPGPTVPFNVLRSDGSFVGYNEVSKLAALNRPPLQLRNGCFCNPGACQDALELSNEQIQSNYLTSGHVCGDQIDIVNGKPTGALRASFGKDSMWEDMDALVMFIEKMFVNISMVAEPATRGRMAGAAQEIPSIRVQLSELYIFPIKSCAAQRVKHWQMTKCGRLAFDREFALVNSSGHAMRLQIYPRMGLLKPVVDPVNRKLTVAAPGCDDLILDLDDNGYGDKFGEAVVKVCGNRCGGKLWGDYEASEWFSSFLGVRCWLARHSGGRYVVPDSDEINGKSLTLEPQSILLQRRPDVAFANEQPLLLVSEHAVSALNGILSAQGQKLVSTRHFRPNLVVKSVGSQIVETNPEDYWSELVACGKGVSLKMVGQCARCSMVDVDPTSGTKGKTLRALADYRRQRGQITFGIFLQGDPDAAQSLPANEQIVLEEGDRFDCL